MNMNIREGCHARLEVASLVQGIPLMSITEEERQTLLALVEDVAGPETREVAIILLSQKGKELTDEILAEELGIKLNQVRKALYKLHDLELASFRRTRDKKTGWFIFYWRFHPEKINSIVRKKQENVLRKIEERLEYEEGNMFFSCGGKDCTRVTFQLAMEQDFICMTCEGRLESFDNSKIIMILQKKLNELSTILD